MAPVRGPITMLFNLYCTYKERTPSYPDVPEMIRYVFSNYFLNLSLPPLVPVWFASMASERLFPGVLWLGLLLCFSLAASFCFGAGFFRILIVVVISRCLVLIYKRQLSCLSIVFLSNGFHVFRLRCKSRRGLQALQVYCKYPAVRLVLPIGQ